MGSRPVDKVASALVSFAGGGVQPANRGKTSMFGDTAPVWTFLSDLGATEDPVLACEALSGHFLIEVFPALALPSLEDGFARRLAAPRYNPQNRRKFRLDDWRAVTEAVQAAAAGYGVSGLARWANQMHPIPQPRKADQDRLDAVLCAVVGLAWRAGPATETAMPGDLATGYMVTPVSDATRPRPELAAARRNVPILYWLGAQP